ncbi:hypothetical protein QDS01_18005 [Acinetobacter nosocomialis]|uniref:hypothetical protein n=1 Tax=Acinetobacter nosocomialis TaxID=106654 RepID=UPI002446B1D7|nr:hypothetical protein [Acinetobacter nosocomialis]MDH2636806.1 hypothetical protein [Acinetobacter nosocomialis]
MSQLTKFNLGGWVRAVDRLPTLADADDAGNVFQSFKSEGGFNVLSDCHFSMFRFLKDRNNLDGNEFWHPKPRAPKLPKESAQNDLENEGSEEGGLWSWQHHEADRKRIAELEKRLEIATCKWTALTSIATTCPNQLPDEFFKKLDELHDALRGLKVEHEDKGTTEA